VAKLVAFFFPFVFSLFSFTFDYSFTSTFFFPFFSSFSLFFTFSLMMPNYLGYLKTPLLAMMGEGVLIPDLERLLEA
jgi:hypothetical protein